MYLTIITFHWFTGSLVHPNPHMKDTLSYDAVPYTFYPILLPPLNTNNFLSFFDSWAQKKEDTTVHGGGLNLNNYQKLRNYFLSELVSPILIILHLNKEQEKFVPPAGMK